MQPLIQTQLEHDGVLLATIDMPGRTMNVFSAELMDALEALMNQVDANPAIQSVVLTSGKPSFLAGADLVMVRGYCDAAKGATHEAMFELCGRLGRQFVRLEASAKPWVAAVNGIALGGGLELSLACRVRVVADDPKIQLGVPEVKLGLLPGAGGTQRLPRLLGFAPAMDLLLSGRAVAPAEAVTLGLFARAVPAAQLLEEARRIARSLHGTAYDANAKYAHLAQLDVPAYNESVAQDIDLQQGVGAQDFAQYPAYSAIIGSVLKGARLPMPQANALEMNQFLRLMFSPVAGRMVRTLFLERLRGEREWAALPPTRIAQLRVGAISPARQAWRLALDRLKLPQTADETLPADTLVLVDQTGARHTLVLRVLDDVTTVDANAPDASAQRAAGQAILAPATAHGRVMEFTAPDDAAAAAIAALAARMWCWPWRTPGPGSVLQRLRGEPLASQAQLIVQWAAKWAGRGGTPDLAFVDVAACLSGIAPAWTGGPLTWLWAEQNQQRASFDAATAADWKLLEPRLRESCS